MVRDVVTRRVLAHFRAHTSPLLLMAFDNSGTLLVTASVHGHSVNVFHIRPQHPREGGGAVLHLYHLSRGVTPAVIQASELLTMLLSVMNQSCRHHWQRAGRQLQQERAPAERHLSARHLAHLPAGAPRQGGRPAASPGGRRAAAAARGAAQAARPGRRLARPLGRPAQRQHPGLGRRLRRRQPVQRHSRFVLISDCIVRCEA